MCCVESEPTVLVWGRREAGVKDIGIDACGDSCPEEVAFRADDAFLCLPEAFF